MEILISELIAMGIQNAPLIFNKIKEFTQKPTDLNAVIEKIQPLVEVESGKPDVTFDDLVKVIGKSASLNVFDGKATFTKSVTIESTDGPASLNIGTTKTPKAGQVIGSINFTNKGIRLEGGHDD